MHLTLYTKDGCHLCDRLLTMIQPWIDRGSISLTLCDIETRDDWYEAYSLRIPVLCHGEHVILEGRPEERQVRAAMESVTRKA